MFRTPFAIMAFLSLSALPAVAQTTTPESASDATTIMDKQAGNQTPPTDNTLSNTEVQALQHTGNTGTQEQTTGAMGTLTGGGDAPSVSGTTPMYKEKTDSAAKTEGQ